MVIARASLNPTTMPYAKSQGVLSSGVIIFIFCPYVACYIQICDRFCRENVTYMIILYLICIVYSSTFSAIFTTHKSIHVYLLIFFSIFSILCKNVYFFIICDVYFIFFGSVFQHSIHPNIK